MSDTTHGTTHDDAPMSAAAALRLLKNQQRTLSNERGSFVFAISLSWGVTLLLGFLALWSVDGLPGGSDGNAGAGNATGAGNGHVLTLPVAITTFVILVVAAIVVSIVQAVRGSRGIRGASGTAGAFTGTVYGVSWSVVMVAIGVLGGALRADGMSATVANIFFPCTYVLAIGLLYLIAGGIWHSVSSVVGGGCVILVAVVAAWVGYPSHYLVLAIGAGGTFLALAIWEAVSTRRIRRAVAGGAVKHG